MVVIRTTTWLHCIRFFLVGLTEIIKNSPCHGKTIDEDILLCYFLSCLHSRPTFKSSDRFT